MELEGSKQRCVRTAAQFHQYRFRGVAARRGDGKRRAGRGDVPLPHHPWASHTPSGAPESGRATPAQAARDVSLSKERGQRVRLSPTFATLNASRIWESLPWPSAGQSLANTCCGQSQTERQFHACLQGTAGLRRPATSVVHTFPRRHCRPLAGRPVRLVAGSLVALPPLLDPRHTHIRVTPLAQCSALERRPGSRP